MLKTVTMKDLNSLDSTRPVFFDIETEELYYNTSLAQFRQDGQSYLVAINSEKDQQELVNFIQPLHLVGYNLAYDFGTLNTVSAEVTDLFNAVKIAYPKFQEFSLDVVTQKLGLGYLYAGLDKKVLQKKGFHRGAYFSQMQLEYASTDVIALELLFQDRRMQEVIAKNLAYRLSIYALKEAMIWQNNGLPVLQDKVKEYIAKTKDLEIQYENNIFALTNTHLNSRSSKQVTDYFGTSSSDKATLTRIAIEGRLEASKDGSGSLRVKARDAQDFTEKDQQVAEALLGSRKAKNDLSKLQGYLGHNKMYGRFKPIGTSTSRWSCSGTPKGSSRPDLFNAQNYSRAFKGCFGVTPNSGKIILAADYATLEIRIATAIMGEENMYKALMNGEDIHKSTASLIFNRPISEVQGKERSNAKVANFGLTYAMGRETFKNYAYDMYGIKFTDGTAKDLIEKFFTAYPGLKSYHLKVGNEMRKSDYICYTALDYPIAPQAYADAINAPTQGTGGECMRLAIHLMVKKDPESLKMIVNSIHDALYLIVPEIDKAYWGKILTDSMKEAWQEIRKSRHFKWHDIPMPCEVMSGYTMGELEADFSGGGQALSIEEMRKQKERNKRAV